MCGIGTSVTLMNWGTLGGVIFTKWDEKSENKLGTWRVENFDSSKFDSFLYGQDFGYSKDPAAGNEVSLDKKNRRLYICDELHEFELTNERLAGKLKPFVGKNYVTCDSAEPKSVQELNEYGVRAVGATKGRDSVNFGIQWLRQLEIIIHPKCVHTIEEFETYKWKQDKSGNVLPVPVDKNNHHIDCLTGDTIVNTTQGDIPISLLVGKTGYVECFDEKTQSKTVSKFYDCRKTHENIEVYEVEMEDGRVIRGTANHPILTRSGWLNISELLPQMDIVDIHNRN